MAATPLNINSEQSAPAPAASLRRQLSAGGDSIQRFAGCVERPRASRGLVAARAWAESLCPPVPHGPHGWNGAAPARDRARFGSGYCA